MTSECAICYIFILLQWIFMLQSWVFIIRYSDDSYNKKKLHFVRIFELLWHFFLEKLQVTTFSATDDVLIKRLLVGNAEVTRLNSAVF